MVTRKETPAADQVTLDVVSGDGYRLAATVYGKRRKSTVVIINSATGVPRQFYGYFAEFLARHGWTAVTYDYRGIGGSAPASLRGFDARMRDWALLDMTAVVDWARSDLEPVRLFAIGHSFGGQTLGMIENARSIDAMVAVSAQSGYWGVQGGAERWRVGFAVYVLLPILTMTMGYFPWRWFASGEDLPRSVALEWASWCRSRNYLLDDRSLPLERYERFESPVLAYSVDDDDWGTAAAVDDMMRAYPNVTRRHLMPANYGLDRVGHMGAFRRGAESLWTEFVDWLERH